MATRVEAPDAREALKILRSLRLRHDPKNYFYDQDAAQRVLDFFALFLKHSKGKFAGEPFVLEVWQRNILITAYGWRRRVDKTRRFREVYLEVPRKNGKSTLAAGLALYHLVADGEAGGNVYSAAADKDQARLVFGEAAQMVSRDPDLASMVEVFKASMVAPETASGYQVLSGLPTNKDGLNISAVIIDELHAHASRDLYDVLKTATGAREQPMVFSITTAGKEREGICWELHQLGMRLLAGEIEDDEFLPVIYGLSDEDDWHDEDAWRRANPNYGVSLKPDYMQAQHVKAMNTPGYEPTFRRYHLNVWGQSEKSWLSMKAWDKCGGPVDAQSLRGRRCFIGIDLSKRTDITAAVALFPWEGEVEGYDVLPRFWMPSDGLEARSKRDKQPYPLWVKNGWIQLCEGNVIDQGDVQKAIEEWGSMYDVVEAGYDPWGAGQLALDLQSRGVQMVEVPMQLKHVSAPSKRLEELVLQRRLRHGGNPVLRWMAQSVVCDVDANENIRPSKRKSTSRIDGIVATIIGLSRAILGREKNASVYESRGIEVL